MKQWIFTFAFVVSASQYVVAQKIESIDYRRSSIYSVLINHTDRQYSTEIGHVFLQMPVPDKYNDHNLSVRTLSTTAKEVSQDAVESFLEDSKIASRLVSRWFNRNIKTGECDVELVKERGLYNASEFDKELAAQSFRGKALLEDAGEELIGQTFVLINDISYIDKANAGKTAGAIFRALGSVMATVTNTSSYNDLGNLAGSAAETLKGFRVRINTHLYQLVWDDAIAMDFYQNYYTAVPDPDKCKAFETKGRWNYKLKYIGSQQSDGGTTSFLGVNLAEPEQMIRKACQRALDENVANLQRNFESFKIKTPLVDTEPLRAEIGMKEGITADSKFEVLEAQMDDNGKTIYKRVGVVKPIANLIWDNRYMAQEEGAEGADLRYTTFKKVSGGNFYPGMFIREIK